MNLWITCGYVCAKALDNLWINPTLLARGKIHPQVIRGLSTACPQGLKGINALRDKGSMALFYLSTATTSTTIYLSKLIYKKKRCDEISDL